MKFWQLKMHKIILDDKNHWPNWWRLISASPMVHLDFVSVYFIHRVDKLQEVNVSWTGFSIYFLSFNQYFFWWTSIFYFGFYLHWKLDGGVGNDVTPEVGKPRWMCPLLPIPVNKNTWKAVFCTDNAEISYLQIQFKSLHTPCRICKMLIILPK